MLIELTLAGGGATLWHKLKRKQPTLIEQLAEKQNQPILCRHCGGLRQYPPAFDSASGYPSEKNRELNNQHHSGRIVHTTVL